MKLPFLVLSGSTGGRGVFALIVAGDEKAAQQLAHRRFWQGIDKDEAPGTFEICKPGCPAELFEILLADRPLSFHEGGNNLAPFLISEADDGDFEYRRMQRKAAFDLDWRDVFASGDDHVIDAAGDEHISVAVDKAGVAGEIPSISKGVR